MLWAFLDLALLTVVAVLGVMVGRLTRRAEPCGDAPLPGNSSETQRAREVLDAVQEVAARVAADVGQHHQRVEEINEELQAAEVPEAESVVGAVTKLLEANAQMQHRLQSAEEKLAEQARQIEYQTVEARTDALTGLSNRRALDDNLAARQAEFDRSGRPFCLLMLDIDHFKRFNDAQGHLAGDEVLRRVGAALAASVRGGDLAARYGGEEFALLLSGTVTETVAVARRVRQTIDHLRFDFQGAELHVTVSGGLAEIRAGEDGAALVNRADEALYASKRSGRNCGHWHDGRQPHPIENAAPTPAAPPVERGYTAPPATAATPPPAAPPAAEIAPRPRQRRVLPQGMARRAALDTAVASRLADRARDGNPPAALLVRVDRYEGAIGQYGHEVGWAMMVRLFGCLTSIVQSVDMVAEYGDGTLAILLPDRKLPALIDLAEHIRQAAAGCTLAIAGEPLTLTVSIGTAQAVAGDDGPRLLCRAEEALDTAYHVGGNCCYFHNGQWSDTLNAAKQRTAGAV
jgi:diguanylate cyclase